MARGVLAVVGVILALVARPVAQQRADPDFDVSVKTPAYTATHPRVTIDQAHNNFHTEAGRYQPFAKLLRNDGYDVQAGTERFTASSLATTRVLVVANALGAGATANSDSSPAAFTPAECDVVRQWVEGGGSLLLVSDHTPMGEANAVLARTLGVTMGRGFVAMPDTAHHQSGPTQLVFSRANGLLADHPITRGRSDTERLATVVSFTGQSLVGPPGATALLTLGADALEAPSRTESQALNAELRAAGPGAAAHASAHAAPVAGRAQGVAFDLGRGRVVVLGEAALLSAQITADSQGKMGMNVPGSDDKQFALNVVHWLSRLF
jgi:hypothetical protein